MKASENNFVVVQWLVEGTRPRQAHPIPGRRGRNAWAPEYTAKLVTKRGSRRRPTRQADPKQQASPYAARGAEPTPPAGRQADADLQRPGKDGPSKTGRLFPACLHSDFPDIEEWQAEHISTTSHDS